MLSTEMVYLSILNETIIVVSTVTKDTPEVYVKPLVGMTKQIDRVLLQSCTGITPPERSEQLQHLKK
jgi:hypothetical protein